MSRRPTEPHTMRVAKSLLLPCVALAVAACGSSKGTTSAAVTTPTHTVTVTTSASTTTTSQTTTTTSGAPICRASTLALSSLGSQGAAGHGLLGFELKNTGSATCSTIGYPGITFLDKAGKPLPTNTTRTTQDYFGSAPKVLLNVAPGASVSFRIGVTHVPTGNATCTTAYGLQVIPPNDTSTLTVSLSDGAYYCQTATVSPVRPGTSAYPSA
jgi:Domain of unknown function (DUF4232)